jgi:hypothetical protein
MFQWKTRALLAESRLENVHKVLELNWKPLLTYDTTTHVEDAQQDQLRECIAQLEDAIK